METTRNRRTLYSFTAASMAFVVTVCGQTAIGEEVSDGDQDASARTQLRWLHHPVIPATFKLDDSWEFMDVRNALKTYSAEAEQDYRKQIKSLLSLSRSDSYRLVLLQIKLAAQLANKGEVHSAVECAAEGRKFVRSIENEVARKRLLGYFYLLDDLITQKRGAEK